MAEGKKSFVLYSDQRTIIDMLSDEKAGQLLKHMFAYVNDENPQTNDPLILLAFEPIKLQMKRDLIKWEKTKGVRSDAGKASAEARRLAKEHQQTLTNSTNVNFVQQSSTNSTVNVNDNVTVNDINIRKANFAESLKPYFETYGKDMLNDFYLYWTEHGIKDKKLRFEKERTFGLERRLLTWSKNNFGNQQKDETTDGYMNHVMKQVNQLKQMQ
jgi:hypothetical protein